MPLLQHQLRLFSSRGTLWSSSRRCRGDAAARSPWTTTPKLMLRRVAQRAHLRAWEQGRLRKHVPSQRLLFAKRLLLLRLLPSVRAHSGRRAGHPAGVPWVLLPSFFKGILSERRTRRASSSACYSNESASRRSATVTAIADSPPRRRKESLSERPPAVRLEAAGLPGQGFLLLSAT